MTEEEVGKKLTELEGQLATAVTKQQELEKANQHQAAVIKLSSEEREVFDALPVEKQDEYLAADVEKRKGYKIPMDKDEEMDPQVAKRMSELEANHKAELAKRDAEMAEIKKRAEQAETIAKAEQERREQVEFAKRAETELSAYSGTSEEKGKLLRALHNGVSKCLSKEEVEGLQKLLEAGNTALSSQMKPIGKDGNGKQAGTAYAKMDAKATEIQKNSEGKLTYHQAFAKVMETNPELYQEYEKEQGGQA